MSKFPSQKHTTGKEPWQALKYRAWHSQPTNQPQWENIRQSLLRTNTKLVEMKFVFVNSREERDM